MLSWVELERVALVLSESLVGGRVERWVEPAPGRIAFSIYRRDEDEKRKCIVDLDSRPDLAHVGLLGRMPKAPDRLPAFSAYLRSHLSRARLESVSLRGEDRQLALSIHDHPVVLLHNLLNPVEPDRAAVARLER